MMVLMRETPCALLYEWFHVLTTLSLPLLFKYLQELQRQENGEIQINCTPYCTAYCTAKIENFTSQIVAENVFS